MMTDNDKTSLRGRKAKPRKAPAAGTSRKVLPAIRRTRSSLFTRRADGPATGLPGRRRTARSDRASADRPVRAPKEADATGRAGTARQSRKAVVVRVLVMLLAFVGMVAFAVALAKVTLTPEPGAVGLVHSNLKPGDSLQHYFNATARDAIKQVGGNIVLGMPFGLLLPVLLPRVRGVVRVLLVTAAVMLLVELVQGAIITGRAFDIDDVILNTTGALLGYLLLGRRISRAVHPPRRRWWQRALGRKKSADRSDELLKQGS